MLLGTLLVPRGFTGRRPSGPAHDVGPRPARLTTSRAIGGGASATSGGSEATLGLLPLPRRDVERLRQILGLQRRLTRHARQPARETRADARADPSHEALTWLEIHGQAPEIVEHWRGFLEAAGAAGAGRGRAARPGAAADAGDGDAVGCGHRSAAVTPVPARLIRCAARTRA